MSDHRFNRVPPHLIHRVDQKPILGKPLMLASAIMMANLFSSAVLAQSSGGTYTLRKFEVTGGGKALGSPYALVATVGQKIVGVQTGGGYKLTSGFHQPKTNNVLFCDGFENNPCANEAKSTDADRIQ